MEGENNNHTQPASVKFTLGHVRASSSTDALNPATSKNLAWMMAHRGTNSPDSPKCGSDGTNSPGRLAVGTKSSSFIVRSNSGNGAKTFGGPFTPIGGNRTAVMATAKNTHQQQNRVRGRSDSFSGLSCLSPNVSLRGITNPGAFKSRTFPIRIRVHTDVASILRITCPGVFVQTCVHGVTTVGMIHSMLIAAMPSLTNTVLVLEGGSPLNPDDIISQLPSVGWALDSNHVPSFLLHVAHEGQRPHQSAVLLTPPAVSLPSIETPTAVKPITQQAFYTLQVRVAWGGQTLCIQIEWEAPWNVVRDVAVPRELAKRVPSFDLRFIGLCPPKELAKVLTDKTGCDIEKTPFASLCVRNGVIPYVTLVEYIAPKYSPVLVRFCQEHNCACTVVKVPRNNVDNSITEKHFPHYSTAAIDKEISSIIENQSSILAEADPDEVQHFIAAARRERYMFHTYTKRVELPVYFTQLSLPPAEDGNTITTCLVSVHLPSRQMSKTVPANPSQSANTLIQSLLSKYYANGSGEAPKYSDYVLKMKGLNSFVFGPQPLASFTHIFQALNKKERPDLVLLERESVVSSNNDSKATASIERFSSPELLELPDDSFSYDHDLIAASKLPWSKRAVLSSMDISSNLRVCLNSIDGMLGAFSEGFAYSVRMRIEHGGLPLSQFAETSFSQPATSASASWREWLEINLPVWRIPQSARLHIEVTAKKQKGSTESSEGNPDQTNSGVASESSASSSDSAALSTGSASVISEADADNGPAAIIAAHADMPIFTFQNELRRGTQRVLLSINSISPTTLRSSLNSEVFISLRLQQFILPVVFPVKGTARGKVTPCLVNPSSGPSLQKVLKQDSLYKLTDADKHLLWQSRTLAAYYPKAIPKFICAADYTNPADVADCHAILKTLSMDPIESIELFESKFADPVVRTYAVKWMSSISTEDVLDCLLELAQAVKFEANLASSLAFFIIQKALADERVGHILYWSLKCDLAYSDSRVRAALMLDTFLRGCNDKRVDFIEQESFLKALRDVATEIKPMRDSERLKHMQQRLKDTPIPSNLVLPLNQEFHIGGIIVDQCDYKDSSKLPLYVVLKNAEEGCEPYHLIFKEGDDLRQDCLTLQMIRYMDKLWRAEGLDLEMSPYRTLCVGATTGLIEVVRNAKTTAEITKLAGGAKAAFKQDIIANWLRQFNTTDELYAKCCRRFALSCAGYCVATYILGICDRHNDNIMIQESGRFLHIDFGHFLGHKKTWLGLNREPAAFVFTPEYAYVMGGKGAPLFEEFVSIACRAYQIVRRHSSIFITLFSLMMSTGIPELQTEEDMNYLRDAFLPDLSEEEASNHFRELIYTSLATRTTQINNAVHVALH